MAVIIADKGKVAVDLSKAFKIMLLPAHKELGIYYLFLNREGECEKMRLPLNDDTDGEALLSYLVQAKESDVILVWEDLLKNFRKDVGKQEEEEVQRLKEEVERLRSEVKRLRNECGLLMSDLDALKKRFEESEEDEEDEEDDELIPVAVDDD
mgnify:CR=1 FL=1